MNPYLSRKLRVISFILIVMVVLLHAHNLRGDSDLINYYVQNLISNGFTKLCVVLFFLISGYLFVINVEEATVGTFLTKIKSRVRTVFIPYLLWSFLGIAIFFILQSLPVVRSFFNNSPISERSASELLYIWLLKPLPYQLWFLRHLFIVVLLSPLLYAIVKYLKYPALLLIALLLLNILRLPPTTLIGNVSLAAFSLGLWFSVHAQSAIVRRYPKAAWWSTLLWMAFVVGRIIFESAEWLDWSVWRPLLINLEYGIGIFALWSLYDAFEHRKTVEAQADLPAFLGFAFFLYLAHEPMLTIFKKLLLKVFGAGTIGQLLTYFAAPAIVIVLCILIGMLLRRSLPKVYSILAGGR